MAGLKKGERFLVIIYMSFVFFSAGLKVSEAYICHKRKTELKVNVMVAEGSNTHTHNR